MNCRSFPPALLQTVLIDGPKLQRLNCPQFISLDALPHAGRFCCAHVLMSSTAGAAGLEKHKLSWFRKTFT
jgi:hypothetical protein